MVRSVLDILVEVADMTADLLKVSYNIIRNQESKWLTSCQGLIENGINGTKQKVNHSPKKGISNITHSKQILTHISCTVELRYFRNFDLRLDERLSRSGCFGLGEANIGRRRSHNPSAAT